MAGSCRHGFHNPKKKTVSSRKRNRRQMAKVLRDNDQIIAKYRTTGDTEKADQ